MNVAIAVSASALNVGDEVRQIMGRVQLAPPIDSMRATRAMIARNPRAQSGPWNLGGMRCFMSFEQARRLGHTQRKALF
ncbi:MAG: hypothetical protein ACK55Z_25185, partial [bacterium]